MSEAKRIIDYLGLRPLPEEGGYFKETYRSKTPAVCSKPRSSGTCILYLMTARDMSYWHKVESDEIWLYHAGSPAQQLLLYPNGNWEERVIGPELAKGHMLQSVIPAGTWQAAVLRDRQDPQSWGLFGAAVSPGFEYEDFAVGEGSDLADKYPSAAAKMRSLGLI